MSGIHVLVVEDDADGREIILQTLSDLGAVVTAVGTAADALAILREGRFHADVVVTDIGMAGEDGFTLLRELRALPPEQGGQLPAIAVTAYATGEDRRRALQAGFAAHIGKPFAPVTLASAIARAVANASR